MGGEGVLLDELFEGTGLRPDDGDMGAQESEVLIKVPGEAIG